MQAVKCTADILNQMYDTFDAMDYKADDYVPTEDELKEICENLPEYMPFLLWIEETGETTEENETIRSIIKSIILKQLEVLDE